MQPDARKFKRRRNRLFQVRELSQMLSPECRKTCAVFRLDARCKSCPVVFLPHLRLLRPLCAYLMIRAETCRKWRRIREPRAGGLCKQSRKGVTNANPRRFRFPHARPAGRGPAQRAAPPRSHPRAGSGRIALRHESRRRRLHGAGRRARSSNSAAASNCTGNDGLGNCSKRASDPGLREHGRRQTYPPARPSRYCLAARHAQNHALPRERRPPLGARNPRHEGRRGHGADRYRDARRKPTCCAAKSFCCSTATRRSAARFRGPSPRAWRAECAAVYVLEPAQGLAYKTARKGIGDWQHSRSKASPRMPASTSKKARAPSASWRAWSKP